jgi:FkbM family methyltransferase
MAESILSERLRRLLARDVELTKRNEHDYLQGRLSSDWRDRTVLFGAGKLGLRVLAGLRRLGIQPKAFVDNDDVKRKGALGGLAVLRPAEAVEQFGADISFIVCVWHSSPIMRQLASLGCRSAIEFKGLFWHFSDEFLPSMRVDRPHLILRDADAVIGAFEGLADAASQEEFVQQIDWLLRYEFHPLQIINRQQYFEKDIFAAHPKEVFVDCGAYTGDTICEYMDHFGMPEEIHAFEPDPANRAILERWRHEQHESLHRRMMIYPYAASNAHALLSFSTDGVSSAVDECGTLVVEARALDDVLGDTPVTFIKMDIEGGEPDAIKGAARLIARTRPVLAVCVYHRQEHLYSIPNQLRSIVDGYHYFIRRYGDEFGDVVCYAVPQERAAAGAVSSHA